MPDANPPEPKRHRQLTTIRTPRATDKYEAKRRQNRRLDAMSEHDSDYERQPTARSHVSYSDSQFGGNETFSRALCSRISAILSSKVFMR